MAIELKRFSPDQLKVTQEQAAFEERNFAQGLLGEAVDASAEMSYVEVMFEKMFMTVPTGFSYIKDLAKAVLKQALTNWFRHATGKDLADPQIHVSVRNTLARNFRSAWTIRVQGGDLTH